MNNVGYNDVIMIFFELINSLKIGMNKNKGTMNK